MLLLQGKHGTHWKALSSCLLSSASRTQGTHRYTYMELNAASIVVGLCNLNTTH
jgi:hypothetical protein